MKDQAHDEQEGNGGLYDRVATQAMRDAAYDIQWIERQLQQVGRKGSPENVGSAIGLRVRQAKIGNALAGLVVSYLSFQAEGGANSDA